MNNDALDLYRQVMEQRLKAVAEYLDSEAEKWERPSWVSDAEPERTDYRKGHAEAHRNIAAMLMQWRDKIAYPSGGFEKFMG